MMSIVAGDAAAQAAQGTAFSVAPELLITNHHVVKGCSSLEVISPDGRRTGSIATTDADVDLAILNVSELKGTTARLRDPTNVFLGEPVLVFGYPGGLSSGGNFTSGVISALRGVRDSANPLQITSPVQRGNSGGPLMDSSGLVIGVIQSKLDALPTGDIPQNVNFAVSLEALTQFLAKHKVDFQTAARSPALDTARVAEMAQNFTHRIACKVSEQRASNAERANAVEEYNEKLRYMREWESDPGKMKHLYKDFEEFVEVSKRAGSNAPKSQDTPRANTKESNDRLSLECAGFTTVPIEPVDRDPVIKASIHLHKAGDKKSTGFEVKHGTLSGVTYARNDQYRDLRFWSDRNGDYWSGVSAKSPRRTMVGQLGYDPSRGKSARRYIEKSFIAGRLEQTTTSTCTCAASATEKASEQCRGVEPSALRQ